MYDILRTLIVFHHPMVITERVVVGNKHGETSCVYSRHRQSCSAKYGNGRPACSRPVGNLVWLPDREGRERYVGKYKTIVFKANSPKRFCSDGVAAENLHVKEEILSSRSLLTDSSTRIYTADGVGCKNREVKKNKRSWPPRWAVLLCSSKGNSERLRHCYGWKYRNTLDLTPPRNNSKKHIPETFISGKL